MSDDRLHPLADEPPYSPFAPTEFGWSSGCRAEDEVWLNTYGYLDFPNAISSPTDALPPGYAAYTAVLHRLEDPDADRHVKWINDPGDDPWQQVQNIVDHGLGSWRWAADNAMAQPEGGLLADVLELDDEDTRLTVSFFFPPWCGTVTAAVIAARLRTVHHDLGYCPTFWFPHSRAWVASSPYDGGWTYIASSAEIAHRLQANPLIETLPCTYPGTEQIR